MVVGSDSDDHVQAVVRTLSDRGHRSITVDAATLDEDEYVIHGPMLSIRGQASVDLNHARGWIRRLAPPWWRTEAVAGSRSAAVRGAHVALTVAIASDPGPLWLTRFDHQLFADNKLLQIRASDRVGVATPATAVTSDACSIPSVLGEDLVIKPLGAGHFLEDGHGRAVYAQRFARKSITEFPFSGAPFLVQSYIPPERHLRVVTVTDRCWVASLSAGGLPVDWRQSPAAHHSFEPMEHEVVSRGALEVAAALGLGYSSQDWLVNGTGEWLIDVNPAGQWLFLPEPIATDVSVAIAAWVSGDGDAF